MSNGTISWGDHTSQQYAQAWQAQGTREAQIHDPATDKDREMRAATTRAGSAIIDLFQDLGSHPFGGIQHLLTSVASGQPPDFSAFLGNAEFDPAALQQDLAAIAQGLRDNPVDTVQNMILGAPTEAIQGVLGGVDKSLEALEQQTGLRAETRGSTQSHFGDYRAYQLHRQIGDFGTFDNQTQTRVGGDFEADGRAKIGIAGAEAEGRFQGTLGASARSDSRLETVLGTATNTSEARADLRYGGEGSVSLDATGLNAQGQVGASAAAMVSTQGRLENALGTANYYANAGVEAFGDATGSATLDATGLRARADARVGVSASAEAGADFRTAGVEIGGERLDINGSGKVRVEASALAEGHAEVNATINPPRAGADIYGTAFAGVKAEAEGQVGIGDFVTLSGHAGAWAGAGAEGGVHLGYDDGKISFGFGGGAAVGYGFGAGWGVEVDVKAIANAAIGGALDLAGKGLEYALDPGAAVRDAGNLAQGVAGAVQSAANAIETTADTIAAGAASVIDSVVDAFKLW
ncbi:MAG: hypothetical protein HYV63_13420 [Candidatus Schekmanbacteria bacterium]|nr:hypothetical protein [Candidatus Schekmanbacteria bacterium]